MSLSWSEEQLRTTGDPRDEAYANMIAAIIADRGDISLPGLDSVLDNNQNDNHNSEVDVWKLDDFKVPEEVEGVLLKSGSNLGSLALESELKKIETAEAIRSGANKLVEPYASAFLELIPDSKPKKGRIRRHKEVEHTVSLERDGHQIEHNFKMSFRDGNGGTKPTFAEARFGSAASDEHIYRNTPTLTFEYDDSVEVSGITLHWGSSSLILARLASPPLRNFLQQAFGRTRHGEVLGQRVHYCNRDGGSELKVLLGEDPGLVLSSPSILATYSLNENGTNELKRKNLSQNIEKIRNSEKLPPSLSPNQFLGLIDNVLKLIPTVSESDLIAN